MTIALQTPSVPELGEVVDALREWQRDDLPLQLHPGDIGWYWRNGTEATAAALRTWRQDGRIVAIGLLDEPDMLRMTVAPDIRRNDQIARSVVADLADPQGGVLPAGQVLVESPDGIAVRDVLDELGWSIGESWTPLRRDLSDPVDVPDLHIEVVGPGQASDFAAMVRAAFNSTRFTDERWTAMADGLPITEGRCLLARDDSGAAVAEIAVWSAGPGRPGLIEPLGVPAEHRGHGYGRTMCLAAAAELRRLGSSSALVCTPSERIPAVATYRSAGFEPLPERLDRTRNAG